MSKKILTSSSSHSICFICKRSTPYANLKKVKPNSVKNVYFSCKIYIPLHARCCRRHLNEQLEIRPDEYNNIQFSLKEQKPETILMLKSFLLQKKGIFDNFNNLSELTEDECIRITGWNKNQFSKFSKLITSVYDTDKRTKEQLIALYRYWLRKGVDQFTLSKLFNNDKTQQQISHYLCQIRAAIYKDFVPYFLGANRSRKFFIKHGNITTKHLHDLKDDDLAIVADGTYTRLEKSANNQVQYDCWSEQKCDLLLKPFIICCPDGWIIDCYGPFYANVNDAKILAYILLNDEDLRKILKPGKTLLLLDNGFRDIYQVLRDEYKLNAKMPSCSGTVIDQENSDSELDVENVESKKNGQLSTYKLNASRLVTKCRFIIEKQNGNIKNKKSLDNIRNTTAGHILIDYRITCAMINFDHKSCCPDGEDALKTAQKFKEKAKVKYNHLNFLLTKQLDTKSIPMVDLASIEDFPKINKDKIEKKIFFGSFQLKECLNYIQDLIKYGKAFQVSDRLFKDQLAHGSNENAESKIVAFQIASRHRRSLIKIDKLPKKTKEKNFEKNFRNQYKVFIQYYPGVNCTKAIKGYICTCKTGSRVAGCCVHVACVIFYLSYGKYTQLNLPAEHQRLIFIDMSKNEKPNKPRCVMRSRKQKTVFNHPEIVSTNSSDSE